MDTQTVVDLFSQALWVMIVIISIIIIPGLIVGLIVAMFQAATQINEMTLNFIPRLLVTLISMMIAAPLLIHLLTDFTRRLIQDIPFIIG